MPANSHWGYIQFKELYKQLCANFGMASAEKIVEIVIVTIGGIRLTVPSLKDLEKRERNRRVCDFHRGDYKETAARFTVSDSTVRRIIRNQRMIDRSKKEYRVIRHEKPIDSWHL